LPGGGFVTGFYRCYRGISKLPKKPFKKKAQIFDLTIRVQKPQLKKLQAINADAA